MRLVQPPIFLFISIGVLLVLFAIWFLKSKSEVRKMIVVFWALALFFFGMAWERAKDLDYERDEIIYQLSRESIHYSDKLLEPFSYDPSLIAYHAITGILLIMIAILEVKLYRWKQGNE